MEGFARRVPCGTCGEKAVGIFKCEGCSQVFCRKHVIEHRDILNQQFEEIIIEYDCLQQAINESKSNQNQLLPFIQQIDQWEKQSIDKIRRAANDARQQLKELNHSSNDVGSMTLFELGEQLQKARMNDNYIENDLQIWTTKLERLRTDMNTVDIPSINIHEDPTKILVGKIFVDTSQKSFVNNDCFDDFIGRAVFEENKRTVYHCGSEISDVYVRGKLEYAKGTHKIRFIMSKRSKEFVMCFNIISASIPKLAISSKRNYCKYGWQTDDSEDNSDDWRKKKSTFRDLRGETTMNLQLTIDCDQRKISYFNERTRNSREINIDIWKCPLPWRLEFYLYDIGDTVQFIS